MKTAPWWVRIVAWFGIALLAAFLVLSFAAGKRGVQP